MEGSGGAFAQPSDQTVCCVPLGHSSDVGLVEQHCGKTCGQSAVEEWRRRWRSGGVAGRNKYEKTHEIRRRSGYPQVTIYY